MGLKDEMPQGEQAPAAEVLGDESALFAQDVDAPRTRKVDLGKKGVFLVRRITPGENAEINERCYVEVQDGTGGMKQVYRPFERQFYLVARALCKPDGSRMFISKTLPDTAWIAKAETIKSRLTQREINLLSKAANDLLGFDTEQAVAEAGKGSSVSLDDSGS